MDASSLSRVAALIPALNEAGSIGAVVHELRRRGVERIVVADNGSTDETAQVVREAGGRVVHEPRRGYGRACLAGLAHLFGHGDPPDVILFLDGDGADELASIPELVGPVLDGEAEMAIGRRVSGRDVGNARTHARVGSRVMLRLARWIHGLEAEDLGPFRAVSRTLLHRMQMDDPTWGWTLQMQLRAHHLGAPVVEVEVPRRPRTAGRSKVSGSLWISVRAGVRMGWTLVREWWWGRRVRRRRKGTPGG